MKFKYILLLALFASLISCSRNINICNVVSPDGQVKVTVQVVDGQIIYDLSKANTPVLDKSKLGYKFKNIEQLGNSVEIITTERNSVNETWEQVWGEQRLIENRYEELIIHLQDQKVNSRKFDLVFRVFNDGLGFRYHIPQQVGIDSITIMDELTEFNLASKSMAWWIPAYSELFYESVYRYTTLNKIDTIATPVTLEMENGLYVAIHEANLTDYAAMNLYTNNDNRLKVDLTPWSTGEKVFTKTGMYSPWRTISIGEKPGDLITSYIALNLNEPNKLEDVSWIKPGKYIGIWWSIHMGKHTWSQGPKHGATTANTKAYMDFAAEHGFDGVLVEGWNNGWDFDWVAEGYKINFTEAYPDFDLEGITKYGAQKGVKLIGHHETGGFTRNYEDQMEDAFELYNKLGVNAVKTGYVNHKNLDAKEFHNSQYGIRHYRKVIETAAKYKIMIDNHEPAMPTGLRRTYPNLMTGEGVRGQEYDAWSQDGGNKPNHTTIVPFTRGLAGPIDFTFGTFNFENTAVKGTRVQTTIAKQLALYVVIYSPLQMASDLPENYMHNKAFDFIKAVPTDWTETHVLDARIGKYIATARKDRNSEKWYLGVITNEDERKLTLDLSFLDIDKTYKAEIYKDGKDANWNKNPTSFSYSEQEVNSKDKLEVKMAKGGGQAIQFIPILNE